MCSISVEPIPSTIRMPVFSYQASETPAGSGSPAETHVCSEPGTSCVEQRPVRGRRGEERRRRRARAARPAGRRASDRRHRTPRSAAGTAASAPSPNVNAIGGVPENTSVERGSEHVARERVAARQQVAVEVHAALRRAGRARGEGDDRDVVGGGVDRLEGVAALGQLLDHAHVVHGHLVRRSPAPASATVTRAFVVTFSISRARSSGIVATATPPASRMPEPARDRLRRVRRVQQHALPARSPATRRPPRRASAARRRSQPPAIAIPSCASSSTAAFTAIGPSRSSRSGQAAAGGRWSRANVSVIAAPPGR